MILLRKKDSETFETSSAGVVRETNLANYQLAGERTIGHGIQATV